ncbi:MAG: valine--tRNA ligase [Candidatus Thorarchaeota archaeon]
MELPKKPDFHNIEKRWREHWKKENTYAFDPKSKDEIYSIDTPPPTISGSLHIGHAFSYSQTEFLARFYRMCGYNVFYPMGFDNNGLPTAILTEKNNGIRFSDVSRDEFVEMALEETKKAEMEYENVLRTLGISCDWSLLYTTIDKRVQRISQLSFLRLSKKNRVYRMEMPTLWCPKCSTAIAQVELEDRELESQFSDILFWLDDGNSIEIATTRPELLPACVAVFVHPSDEKNKHLIGKKSIVPLFGHVVPILEDHRVDPKIGTGIVMCCTFGDLTDIEWFRAHKLELREAIDENGNMTDIAGKYKDMTLKQARDEIIEDLKANKLLTDFDKITHTVNVHERCGTEIEFLTKKQWFIKYLDLKNEFLLAGKKMKWYPPHMRVRYDNWIKGLQWDWCISRQRHYGIPFPVWYCESCGETIFAEVDQLPVNPFRDRPKKRCKCGSDKFRPESDVLDTWATSSLTPFINSKWSEDDKFFKKLYPMTLRANAHDIITFWDFNTVAMDWMHSGVEPFKDIMISGHGLDSHGKKISKSKGNVINPLEMVEKYSADALRWWAASVKLGQDLWFRESDVKDGIKITIKLWNSARFIQPHLKKPKKKPKLEIIDRWILDRLNQTIAKCTESFLKYEYNKAKAATEQFFYHVLCNNYLEMVKNRIYQNVNREAANYTLYHVLMNILKLFAPFMPFITEELYQKLFALEKSIHISKWPETNKEWTDKSAGSLGDLTVKYISELRKYKAQSGLSVGAELDTVTLYHSKPSILKQVADVIQDTMRIKNLKMIDSDLKNQEEEKMIFVG